MISSAKTFRLICLLLSLVLSFLSVFVIFHNGGKAFYHIFYLIPTAVFLASRMNRWKYTMLLPFLCMLTGTTAVFLLAEKIPFTHWHVTVPGYIILLAWNLFSYFFCWSIRVAAAEKQPRKWSAVGSALLLLAVLRIPIPAFFGNPVQAAACKT